MLPEHNRSHTIAGVPVPGARDSAVCLTLFCSMAVFNHTSMRETISNATSKLVRPGQIHWHSPVAVQPKISVSPFPTWKISRLYQIQGLTERTFHCLPIQSLERRSRLLPRFSI